MAKRSIVMGIATVLMLSFCTVVFSNSINEKGYIDFPEADLLKGERFIYGTILKVDYEKRELTIEQHMDDNSIKSDPILKVRNDAIIILHRNDKYMNIDFQDIKIGDIFGLVLDGYGMVRGIIISV